MIHQALDLFIHLDKHLNDFAAAHRIGVYILLAVIVFCETGLVVTPFLPGDSLLFAVGALAATDGSPIHLPAVIVMLCLCANCGDLLNYSIGFRVGPKVFSRESSWLLNKKHLEEAHRFYQRHGRKTIIIARFVPIIRTFAPFVAGIGRMSFSRFIGFSVSGGLLWVVTLTMAGYRFGRFPWVKTHFQVVILAIIVISLIPAVIHAWQARRRSVNRTPGETTADAALRP
ncbi:MAG: DedA family protein [Tepidisphaeraceae bacterium]|jgi:membrane-associated protein